MAPHLPVTGTYNGATKRAVKAYQRKIHVRANGVVAGQTWTALQAGRRN
jgi:peptidoglycan hydrolase-like protein with peptidoglycan-binding domain